MAIKPLIRVKTCGLLAIGLLFWTETAHGQTRSTLQMDEISVYFAEQGYLLLDSNRWNIDPELFPLENDQFFYISYAYENETINKRLFALDRSLLVTRYDLFRIDGQPIEPQDTRDFELFYYIMDEKRSEKVTNLKLTVLPLPKLKYDIRTMIKQYHMEGRPAEQTARAIANVWKTRYGNVDLSALQRLVEMVQKEQP